MQSVIILITCILPSQFVLHLEQTHFKPSLPVFIYTDITYAVLMIHTQIRMHICIKETTSPHNVSLELFLFQNSTQ